MVSKSASESRPALCSTLACAFEANTSYGASTQSKWVDTLRANIASEGPPEKRPPHSAPSFVLCCSIPIGSYFCAPASRSRLLAICELRPCRRTKPLARVWSKVSPVS